MLLRLFQILMIRIKIETYWNVNMSVIEGLHRKDKLK